MTSAHMAAVAFDAIGEAAGRFGNAQSLGVRSSNQ